MLSWGPWSSAVGVKKGLWEEESQVLSSAS